MMTSVDGKITGSFMETKSAELAGKEYERINAIYKPQAWLCGVLLLKRILHTIVNLN